MNCRDFRRRLLVDPARGDVDVARHAARCPACAAELARARAFEETLRAVLTAEIKAHPMPGPGPANRSRRRHMAQWALAATLLLALGLITQSNHWLPAQWSTAGADAAPLVPAVLDHIAAEPAGLEATDAVAEPTVTLLLVSLGLQINARALGAQLAPIRYAARCRIRNHDGLHLVLTGEAGPVTLLLMPHTPLRRTAPIRSERFQGLLIPAGRGSLAIIGTANEPVVPIARRIQRDLVW
jgi:hypothetical protein